MNQEPTGFVSVNICTHYYLEENPEDTEEVEKVIDDLIPIEQPDFLPYADVYYGEEIDSEFTVTYSNEEPTPPDSRQTSKSTFVFDLHETDDTSSVHLHTYASEDTYKKMLDFHESVCSEWDHIELTHYDVAYLLEESIDKLDDSNDFVNTFNKDAIVSGISFSTDEHEFRFSNFYDSTICIVTETEYEEIEPTQLKEKVDDLRDHTTNSLEGAGLT